MQIVNKPLLDMNGDPIMSGEIAMTVANVLMNVALQPPPQPEQGKPPTILTSKESMQKYELGMKLNKVGVNETFELSVDEVSMLTKELPRIYIPIIAGQVAAIIEGK